MQLNEIYKSSSSSNASWLIWSKGIFSLEASLPKDRRRNRETLARVYQACVKQVEILHSIDFDHASRLVRALWIEETDPRRPKDLPRIIGEDGFLRLYALGAALKISLFRRIWERLSESPQAKTIELEPLHVEWNDPKFRFNDIDATPPGLFPKLLPYFRLKKDKQLLRKVAHDLEGVSRFADPHKREWLSLAILSHGASYRELEGEEIWVPSFRTQGKMILYKCTQHLIAEGIKTVSMYPQTDEGVSIYLAQGTELWPSQPSVLGSVLANFAEHGSGAEAYSHSWRRIHRHLRDLPGKPLVAGHSLGGALSMQIGLYSHNLVERIYAFNPPVPNLRDYLFYHQMPKESQEKIHVIANLDDFAFWRVGSKIIGKVTLFLGKKRWKYYSVSVWDCLLFFPAFIKFMRNVWHAFPAHQNVAALRENWVWFQLTQAEIEKENQDRLARFDYLHFLPKLYDPMRLVVRWVRKIFRWRLETSYLRNEIEILALHERDLIDTIDEGSREEIEQQLQLVRTQKQTLISLLQKKIHK